MPTRRSNPFVLATCATLLLGAACSKDRAAAREDTAGASAKPAAGDVAGAATRPGVPGTIPVTTSSEEARALYLKGAKLQLELRATDARALFEQAVAKDPKFALAHLGMANTAASTKDFFAALDQAVALVDTVSEPERQWIKGVQAGAKADLAGQEAAFRRLVDVAPGDPQAQTLLGNYHFGQQDYAAAIDRFQKAIALDPTFTQSYNQLGYAYRFLGQYDEAEKTFKQYIDLIPNDPNPYDSYAELLMKRGKFDESIASYEKALAINPNFVASYVGIGNDHMFAGRGDQARAALAKLGAVARNPGEQRQALLWTAVSYNAEGRWDEALKAVEKMSAISKERGDLAPIAFDHNFAATTLLAAGKPDAAAAEFKLQLETIAKADVPDAVKAAAQRNGIYDRAWVALEKHDLKTAKALLEEYATAVQVKRVPGELRQHHELAGMVALEEKRFADAATELAQGNQQDPRIVYLIGVAYRGAGEAEKAKEAFTKAYEFNQLALSYGLIRTKAKEALAKG